MKKILIAVPTMPYPFTDGGRKAQYDFIENTRFSFKITMTFIMREDEMAGFEELKLIWKNVEFLPFIVRNNKVETILSIPFRWKELTKRSFGYAVLRSNCKTELDHLLAKTSTLFRSSGLNIPLRFLSHFKQIVQEHPFDFVQIEFHDLLPLSRYVPSNVRKIYIHHELRYIREKRELELYSFRSKFLERTYAQNKEFELSELNKYDVVCTLSENDANILSREEVSSEIRYSPIPVKLDENAISFESDHRLVFIGGESHFPNKEGVQWFITNCWNDLKTRQPSLQFEIIGKWTTLTANYYETAYKDIRFLGFVDDLPSTIKNAIMIVPIRIGSGIRIKIIDSVNIGVPFVSTSVGVEGLAFEHDVDCLIGDSPEEFNNMIERIIESDTLGLELAKNAKKKFMTEYSYDELISRRIQLYNTNQVISQ